MRNFAEGTQSSRPLFRDAHVAIGEYRWDATRAGMRRQSWTGDICLIAVPKTAVRITHEGAAPVIADRCTAIFYNPGQVYSAEQLLDGCAEETIYFVPDRAALHDCLRELDPSVDDHPVRPIAHAHGPVDARSYAALRSLVEALNGPTVSGERIRPESIAVHEALIALTSRMMASAYRAKVAPAQTALRSTTTSERRRRDTVVAAHEYLVRNSAEPLGLQDIALAAGTSRYHLCRLFRAATGRSIHEYLTELRLRASLDGVCDPGTSLAHVAIDAGFSSQSHFTTAFQRRFGRTPARFRRDVRTGRFHPARAHL